MVRHERGTVCRVWRFAAEFLPFERGGVLGSWPNLGSNQSWVLAKLLWFQWRQPRFLQALLAFWVFCSWCLQPVRASAVAGLGCWCHCLTHTLSCSLQPQGTLKPIMWTRTNELGTVTYFYWSFPRVLTQIWRWQGRKELCLGQENAGRNRGLGSSLQESGSLPSEVCSRTLLITSLFWKWRLGSKEVKFGKQ